MQQVSLQDRFKQFQSKRNQDYQYKKHLIQASEVDKTSKEWMDNLRSKFIQQAKKYIGIPYHSRYHDETSPYHNAPLYLDCSGLIRQIIFDLRECFGFTLGKWNQAYQFDLLDQPIRFEQIRAGDLIFYSGTYYSKNQRRFQHDIVHVEIYMGDDINNEQSIGARLQDGLLSEFQTYKFESKNYYDIQYHYKSIDPWLQGICKSYCKEHPWRDDRDVWMNEKYSLFSQNIGDNIQIQQQQTKRVYVGEGNNAEVIKQYFRNKQEYTLMDTVMDAFKNDYYIKWVQCPQSINYQSYNPQLQMINHIPKASFTLGHKIPLLELLREQKCEQLLPVTYRLDKIAEVIQLLNDDLDGIWIYKPYNLNCGKGIRLIDDIKLFKNDLKVGKQYQIGDYYKVFVEEERNKLKQELQQHLGEIQQLQQVECQKYHDINPNGILQKYIEKPLLLENRKFDFRCYALIATTKPYRVYFHLGYARLSLFQYSTEDIENTDNAVIHLTNAAIQKQHPKYKSNKESTIWSMQQFNDYVMAQYGVTQDIILNIYEQMKQQTQTIFSAARMKIEQGGQNGEFELFGLDYLVDEQYKVYFLEANINPALFTDNQILRSIIPPIINQTLDIVLNINQNMEYNIGTYEQLI